MSLFGKIVGGGAGYYLGGPLGAVAGAVLGHHLLDQKIDQFRQSQAALFVAVFGVMGHISKADGRVSHEEIDFAMSIMEWMNCDANEREAARHLFRQGRDSEIELDECLEYLSLAADDPRLIDGFIRMQIHIACVDGHLDPRERKILEYIQHRLNLPSDTIDSILQERSQFAFFTATFWVMGHISKADGRVSRKEIGLAMRIMKSMDLDANDRKIAREIFANGRDSSVTLDEVLDQLRRECNDSGLIESFLSIQTDAAMADGKLHHRERKILEHIQRRLGLPSGTVNSKSDARSIDDWAYKTLELEEGCSKEDIEHAYLRLTSLHHPDNPASQILSEEMERAAAEKTRNIRVAYERLRLARSTK